MKRIICHNAVRFTLLLPCMALLTWGCGNDAQPRAWQQSGTNENPMAKSVARAFSPQVATALLVDATSAKPSPTRKLTPSPTPNPGPQQIIGDYVQRYDHATTLKIDAKMMITTNLAVTISTRVPRVPLHLPNPLSWDSARSLFTTPGSYTRTNGQVVPLTLTADGYDNGNELDITVITQVYDADTNHFIEEAASNDARQPVDDDVAATAAALCQALAGVTMGSANYICHPGGGGGSNCPPCPKDTSHTVDFPYNFIKP